MKTYTLEEIRQAFSKTFHDSGEIYFGGEPDDFASEWEDLEENIGADKKLCAVCGTPTDNAGLCDKCVESCMGWYR